MNGTTFTHPMTLRSAYRKLAPLALRNGLWNGWAKLRSWTRIAVGRGVSIVLIAISPLVLVRVGRLTINRLGHMVQAADTYLRLQRDHPQSKRRLDVIIVSPPAPPANAFMWRMITDQVPVSPHAWVHKLLGFAEPGMLRNRNYLEINETNLFYTALSKPPAFHLAASDRARGQKAMEELGLAADDWFVCLANRDQAFLDKVAPGKNWSYHDFRDSAVGNLTGAAEEIMRRGGVAIRMGSLAAEPWPDIEARRIIDIASIPHDPFLDIYLSATCRFFIASNSGINVLPTAFGRRVSTTNYLPASRLSPPSGGFTLPKLFRDTATGELLHLRKAKELGLFDRHNDIRLQRSDTYAALGVETVENDVEDMRGLCRDMFDYGDRTEVPADIKELQDFYEREYLGADHPHLGIGSPIAPSFLKRHRDLIV